MRLPATIALLLLSGCAGEDSYPCEGTTVQLSAESGIPNAYECFGAELDRCTGPLAWVTTSTGDLVVECSPSSTVFVTWM